MIDTTADDRRHRRLALAFVDFLTASPLPVDVDNELVDVAIQCLSSAFHVDPSNPHHFVDLGVRRCESNSAGGRVSAVEELLADHLMADRAAGGAGEGPAGTEGGGSDQQPSGGGGDAWPQQQQATESQSNGAEQRADATAKATEVRGGGEGEEGGTSEAIGPGGAGVGGASGGVDVGGVVAGGSKGRMDVEAKLEEFLAGLEAAGFYAGTQAGSDAYEQRQQQAVSIFHQCTSDGEGEGEGGEGTVQEHNGSERQEDRQSEEGRSKSMAGSVETERRTGAGGSGEGVGMGGSAVEGEGAGHEVCADVRMRGEGKEKGEEKRDGGGNAPSGHGSGSGSGHGGGSEGLKKMAEELKAQGNAAMAAKRFDDALMLYSEAISLCPSNAVFFANRAAAHHQLGNFMAAVSDSESAIALDRRYSKAFSRLGHALLALGRAQEAIERGFKKALELDPSNPNLKENLKAANRKLDEQRNRQQQQQQHQPGSFFPQFNVHPGQGGAQWGGQFQVPGFPPFMPNMNVNVHPETMGFTGTPPFMNGHPHGHAHVDGAASSADPQRHANQMPPPHHHHHAGHSTGGGNGGVHGGSATGDGDGGVTYNISMDNVPLDASTLPNVLGALQNIVGNLNINVSQQHPP